MNPETADYIFDHLCFGFHEIGAVIAACILVAQFWRVWKLPDHSELGWLFVMLLVTLDFFERLHVAH